MRRLTLFCAAVWLWSARALTKSFTLKTNRHTADKILGPSGILRGGLVHLSAQNFSLAGASPTFVVLVTKAQEQDVQTFLQESGSGSSDENRTYVLCDLPTAYRFHVSELLGSGVDFIVAGTDQYTFRALHCVNAAVHVDIHVEFLNPDSNGELQNHLPIEDAALRNITGWFGYAYVGLLSILLLYCIKNFAHVQKFHIVGVLVLVSSAAEAFVNQRRFEYTNDSGSTTIELLVVQKSFKNLTRFLVLGAMLLLSMGWGTLRQTLTFRETRVFVVCMSIYGTLAGLSASCVSSDNDCVAYSLTETISRALVQLVIIVATNFNMSNLRARVCERSWSVEAVLAYAHLKQLATLRRIFFAFVLFPTAISILDLSLLRWEYKWVRISMEYIVMLVLVAGLGNAFRPTEIESDAQRLAQMGMPRAARHANSDEVPLVNPTEAR